MNSNIDTMIEVSISNENKSDKSLSCIIIESNVENADLIQRNIVSNFPDIHIADVETNAGRGLKLLEATNVDFVFMDLEMERYNGIRMLEEIGGTNFGVVFTANNDRYAMKALQYSALGYLIKPLQESELNKAINKVVKHLNIKSNLSILKNLVDTFENKTEYRKLAIPTGDGFLLKEMNEIIRIQTQDRYSLLYFKDGTSYMSSYALGKYKVLLQLGPFIQTHKSHIVNYNYIEEYMNSGSIIMSNGDNVPVSKIERKRIQQELKSIQL